jgi:trehalose 6-phosphate phosphatase
LARTCRRLGCERALYVGDDDTDEDAFAMGGSEHLLAIRVGRKRGSRAAYFLRNQALADELLRRLLGERRSAGR